MNMNKLFNDLMKDVEGCDNPAIKNLAKMLRVMEVERDDAKASIDKAQAEHTERVKASLDEQSGEIKKLREIITGNGKPDGSICYRMMLLENSIREVKDDMAKQTKVLYAIGTFIALYVGTFVLDILFK